MSPELARLIFEVAQAGEMVILPAMQKFNPILCLSGQGQHLPQDLLDAAPILCKSAEELELMLLQGHAAWTRYRDQIVSRHVDGNPDQPPDPATS